MKPSPDTIVNTETKETDTSTMLKKPIFILGCHKSGTSLLRNLLDGHPDLFVLPIEAHFFQHLGYSIQYALRKQKSAPYDVATLKQNYRSWIHYYNQGNEDRYGDAQTRGWWDIQEFNEALDEFSGYEDDAFAITNFVKAMYRSLHKKKMPSTLRCVEKSVENAEFAVDLKKLFPDAKFVHTVRNPYAVLASLRKHKSQVPGNKHAKKYPFLKDIVQSLENSFYFLEKNLRLFSSNDYLVIRYEDLVNDTGQEMAKVCDFLTLGTTHDLSTPTTMGKAWFGNSTSGQSFGSVSTASLDRWKQDISALEVHIVNRLFSEVLISYNYVFHQTTKTPYHPHPTETLPNYLKNRLLWSGFL